MSKIKLLFLILFLAAQLVQAQQSGVIQGIVLDENGEPLPFATVYIKNTSNGTATNAKGNFKLNVPYGQADLMVQYIGYKQNTQRVEVSAKTLNLSIQMQPSDLQLGEVVITGEDPAYAIMRAAIAKRSYYRDKVRDYSVDVYIKGFYKMMDAPKKIMGKDVGDMGGILDSNRTGIIYLAESVSKVYEQKNPSKKKEVMISSKVSGAEGAYSMNRATLTDFDLYNERININRDILSPLADNAFNYYVFKYIGEYTDNNGYKIEKIQLRPKREYDPAFSGYLYIVDQYWNLAGADLALTGNAIKQPILDTMRFRQEFALLEKPDTWRLLSQVTNFKFGLLGFKIGGFYNSVFSNYNLTDTFGQKFFNRETFKIEPIANQRDTVYWSQTRPVPLTLEETRDYTRKDSIYRVQSAKPYLDSVDRVKNRFELGDLLTGYSWDNTYKKTNLRFPGLSEWIQFNAVQGLAFYFKPSYTRTDEKTGKSLKIMGDLNYGASEQRFRASFSVARKFESIQNRTLKLSGGVTPTQYNSSLPIGPGLNGLYSLYGKLNYMKLYEKTFARAEWSQHLGPGVFFKIGAEWNDREALVNNTNYSFRKKERTYAPNDPIPSTRTDGFFGRHQAFLLDVEARFRIGETYNTFPDHREYFASEWPDLYVRYKKAIAGIAGSDVDYDLISAELRKTDLSLGLAGYTDLRLDAGIFLRSKRVEFIDYQHFDGNQTWFGGGNFLNSFFMLPYYNFSTQDAYATLHVQHHLQGWLLDKIPVVRRLNWKEVFGVNVLWTRQDAILRDQVQNLPYWEVNFGFENIGYKFVRPLRIDVINSFQGSQYSKIGLVLSVSL
ncbi:MAG: DUF5686 and carboxypeptidase regulatory-like domain-containing protein [Saprospiraceae bacterium]|nr:DUF5686 and carboxypeptidase regulatory-like domain-containing protein [Saprospiraceae bacterium]